MQCNAIAFQTVSARPHHLGDILIKGVAKWNMSHYPRLEKGKRPNTLCAVNDLIWHDKIPRLDGFLQTTHGRKGNHRPDTNTPQSSNVGSVRYLVRRNLVVCAVSAEEGDGDIFAGDATLVVEDGDRRGRLPPGRLNFERRYFCEAWKVLQTGAANDGDADVVY